MSRYREGQGAAVVATTVGALVGTVVEIMEEVPVGTLVVDRAARQQQWCLPRRPLWILAYQAQSPQLLPRSKPQKRNLQLARHQ